MNAGSSTDLTTAVLVEPTGLVRIELRGRLDARTVPACWTELQRRLPVAPWRSLEIDVSGVGHYDGAGLALLRYLNMGRLTPGAAVRVTGLTASVDKLFRGFTREDYEAGRSPAGVPGRPMPEEVGLAVREMCGDVREQVEFLGAVAGRLPASLANPKLMRWPEVGRVFERAGANAVPIVSLLSLLVGLIIAFESTQPLAQFGAQIYVANLIGLVMVRELGPLLAAILLAGRSGSAFAAEIGTMKVNEELNALATLGLDPIRYLVVQRIVAGILLAPLLTYYATFMGVLGGVLVTLVLGFPLSLVWHQLATSVHLSDVVLGTAKSLVFGAIVASVGCLRGLQTLQGPSAVGISTTRAVVSSILLIVLADALFSILYFALQQ